MPGAGAFTKIGPKCHRISMDVIAKRYGSLPMEAVEQDRLFYAIYHEFKDETGVLNSHRSYLATRDIATINPILVAPLPSFAWIFSGSGTLAAAYSGSIFLIYLLSAVAAQNYSVRLVENVLSSASACTVISNRSVGSWEKNAR